MPPKRKFTGEISRNFIKNDYRRGVSRHGKRALRGDSALRLGKRLRNGQLKVTKFQTRAQKAKASARQKNESLYADLLDEKDLEGVEIDDEAMSSGEEEMVVHTVAATSTNTLAAVHAKPQIKSPSTRACKAAKDLMGLDKVFSPGAVAGGVGFGHTRTRQLHIDYVTRDTLARDALGAPAPGGDNGDGYINPARSAPVHVDATLLDSGARNGHDGYGVGESNGANDVEGACNSDILEMCDHDLDISDSDSDNTSTDNCFGDGVGTEDDSDDGNGDGGDGDVDDDSSGSGSSDDEDAFELVLVDESAPHPPSHASACASTRETAFATQPSSTTASHQTSTDCSTAATASSTAATNTRLATGVSARPMRSRPRLLPPRTSPSSALSLSPSPPCGIVSLTNTSFPAPSPTALLDDPVLHLPPHLHTRATLLHILRHHFNHRDFNPGQQEAITAILRGESSLLVLPTGCGKSLCYIFAAYVLKHCRYRDTDEGAPPQWRQARVHAAKTGLFLPNFANLCVVVSPLVSLMQDQLAKLPPHVHGAAWTADATPKQTELLLSNIGLGHIDILFVSPERLAAPACQVKLLRALTTYQRQREQLFGVGEGRTWTSGAGLPCYDSHGVSLACVDEAHCVSEWSHAFRHDYLRLSRLLTDFLRAPVILALTATASTYTQHDVCKLLHIPLQNVYRCAALRHNLFLACVYSANKLQDLLTVLRSPLFVSMNPNLDRARVEQPPDAVTYSTSGRTGGKQSRYKNDPRYRSVIVYAHTQYACDHLQLALKSEDIRCAAYHAGIDNNERHRTQQQFLRNELDVIVATIAFGMGLDKSNVGAVVHYTVAPTIENMVQEVGRAGRDGRASYCIALYNDTDVTRHLSHAHSDGMDRGAVEGVFRAVFEEAEKRGGVELARAAEEGELVGVGGAEPQRPRPSSDMSAANTTASTADDAITGAGEEKGAAAGDRVDVGTDVLSLLPTRIAPLSHAARLQRGLNARAARAVAGAGISGACSDVGAGADPRAGDSDLDLLPAARRRNGQGSVSGKAGAKRRKGGVSLVIRAESGTDSEASDNGGGAVEGSNPCDADESNASDVDDCIQRVRKSAATSSTSTRKSAASRSNGLTHPSLVNPARSRARVYVPVDVRALASSLGLTEPMVNTVLAQGLLLSAAHCELFRTKIDVARQRGVEVRETVMAVAVEKLGQTRGAGYYDMVNNAHNVAKLGFLRGSPLALLWEHVSVMAAMVQCGCVEVVTEEAWNQWREETASHAETTLAAQTLGLPLMGAVDGVNKDVSIAVSAHAALDDMYQGNKLNNPYYTQKLSQVSRGGASDPRRVYRYFLPAKYRAMVEDEQAQCGVWARETVYFRFKARSSGIYPLDLCQACNDTQLPMAVLQKDIAYLRAHRKITVAWDQPATVLRVTARPSSTALLTDIVHYKLERHERFAAQKVRIASLALQLASLHPLLSHPHALLPMSAEQVYDPATTDDDQGVNSRGSKNNDDPLSSRSTFSRALAALTQPATGAVPATMQGMRGVSAALAQLQLQQIAWDAHARCIKKESSLPSSSASSSSSSSAAFLSPLVSGAARASLPWHGSLLHVLMAEYLSSPQPHLLEDKLKRAIDACRKCGRNAARFRAHAQADASCGDSNDCANSATVGVGLLGTCRCGYAVDADVLASYGNVGGRGEIMDGVFAYRSADTDAEHDDVATITDNAPSARKRTARVGCERSDDLLRNELRHVHEDVATSECEGMSSDRNIGHGSRGVPVVSAACTKKPNSANPTQPVHCATSVSDERALEATLASMAGSAADTPGVSSLATRATIDTSINVNSSRRGSGEVSTVVSQSLPSYPATTATTSSFTTYTSSPLATTIAISRPPRVFALPTLPPTTTAVMPPAQYATLRLQLQGLVRSHADSGDGALATLAMELPRTLTRRLQTCYEELKQCDRDAAVLTREAAATTDLSSTAASAMTLGTATVSNGRAEGRAATSPITTPAPSDTCALPTTAVDPTSSTPSSDASSTALAGVSVDTAASSSSPVSTSTVVTPMTLYQRKYAILFPFLDLSFGGLSPRLLARLCHALPSPTLPSGVWRNHALWGAWQTTPFDSVRVCACEAIVRVACEERQRAEQWEKEQSRKRAEMRRNAKKQEASDANAVSNGSVTVASASSGECAPRSLSARVPGSLSTPYSAAAGALASALTATTVGTTPGVADGATTSGAIVTPTDVRVAAATAAEAAIARCSAVTPATTTVPPPRRRLLPSVGGATSQRLTAPAVGAHAGVTAAVASAGASAGVGGVVLSVHAGTSARTAVDVNASADANTLRARLVTQYGVGTSLSAAPPTSTRLPAPLSSAHSARRNMRVAASSASASDMDAVDPALLALLRDKNL